MKPTQYKQTHPKVLINPLVEPSAYREHMSPIWRKLDILSDMIAQGWLNLQKIESTGLLGIMIYTVEVEVEVQSIFSLHGLRCVHAQLSGSG